MSEPVQLTIVKNDHAGREVWRYQGRLMERTDSFVRLEAYFSWDEMDKGYAIFRKGDRFVEQYFTDHWYAIFEIYDRDTNCLTGWYCNFNRPARFEGDTIYHDDLALDLWIYPDGQMLVLDREEFDRLPISAGEREAVLDALADLQQQAQAGLPPFAR